MKEPIVIIGMGQMGGVFARAFLNIGHPVYPVLRSTSLIDAVDNVPEPTFVLLAVGMKDLHSLLRELPAEWNDRLGFLQNELLPQDWETHKIENPTVSVIWFEKKHRHPVNPLIPTPIFGKQAAFVAESLSSLRIPIQILKDEQELTRQLVLKNLHILTANVAGLVGDETLGGLLENHPKLVKSVFDDVFALQETLTGQNFDSETLWKELQRIFKAHPEHGSKGRSAPERLQRALDQAEEHGLSVPQLHNIAEEIFEG